MIQLPWPKIALGVTILSGVSLLVWKSVDTVSDFIEETRATARQQVIDEVRASTATDDLNQAMTVLKEQQETQERQQALIDRMNTLSVQNQRRQAEIVDRLRDDIGDVGNEELSPAEKDALISLAQDWDRQYGKPPNA